MQSGVYQIRGINSTRGAERGHQDFWKSASISCRSHVQRDVGLCFYFIFWVLECMSGVPVDMGVYQQGTHIAHESQIGWRFGKYWWAIPEH